MRSIPFVAALVAKHPLAFDPPKVGHDGAIWGGGKETSRWFVTCRQVQLREVSLLAAENVIESFGWNTRIEGHQPLFAGSVNLAWGQMIVM